MKNGLLEWDYYIIILNNEGIVIDIGNAHWDW